MLSPASCLEDGGICAYVGHASAFAGDTERIARALAWMSPAERQRYERFRHDRDRWMFGLGREMARSLVGVALGVAPESWIWREGPHGRPEIAAPDADLHFNLSHSAGIVACALARGRTIGVDVEDLSRRAPDPAIVTRYCSPAEAEDVCAQGDRWRDRFLTYWTLKEAYLKARGLGISVHLSDISFTLGDGPSQARIGFRESLAGTDDRWAFHLVQIEPHHIAAVAVGVETSDAASPALSFFHVLMPATSAGQPRLLATSDVHVSHRANRSALELAGSHPSDWLIIAGDVGEKPEHLRWMLDTFVPRYAKVIWTPGNHDLWCPPGATDRTRGQARYDELVTICRSAGVLTPEDPFARFPDSGGTYIVPMFLLFDYTFRPPGVDAGEAIAWAKASGVVSGDEQMLSPEPWPTIEAWCHARCEQTQTRLDELPSGSQTVLVSHWPLRYDLARPPRVPRFSIWCGTTRTEDWAVRYRARAVVSGHLHLRTTMWRHGVRYEEVSLGYPRDWRHDHGFDWYLREILPGTSADSQRFVPPRDPFR